MRRQPWRHAWTLGRETVVRYLDNGGPLFSAALAFFAILSAAPLVLVAVFSAGLAFGEEAARGELHGKLTAFVGDAAAQSIEAVMEALRHQRGDGRRAGLIGAALVLLGASRLFAQIQEAINKLWYVRTEFSDIRRGVLVTLTKRLLSLALVLVGGALFTASLLANVLSATVRRHLGHLVPVPDAVWTVSPALTSVVLTATMFALVYRWMPDATVAWRDAALGGSLAAVLFTLAEYPLNLYLAHQSSASAYGAAGSLVIFLLWAYYAAQIFFLGAQFTWVWAAHAGRHMLPEAMAVIVKEVPVLHGVGTSAAQAAEGPAPAPPPAP